MSTDRALHCKSRTSKNAGMFRLILGHTPIFVPHLQATDTLGPVVAPCNSAFYTLAGVLLDLDVHITPRSR